MCKFNLDMKTLLIYLKKITEGHRWRLAIANRQIYDRNLFS